MTLILRQVGEQRGRIDLRDVTPERLAKLQLPAIRELQISVDNRLVSLSSCFTIEGTPSDELIIEPGSERLDQVGAGMNSGSITVSGNVGHYAGREMSGGKLRIEGSAGDFTGSAMQGGEILVQGDAGDSTGAPAGGGTRGQSGGVIQIQGSAGDRAGECQRRGLLIIEGDAGDLAGYRMIAGTLYIAGKSGEQTGLGMRRGTILLNRPPARFPATINHSGALPLTFLTLLMRQLRQYLGHKTPAVSPVTRVERYLGDLACQGLGEIIILE